MNGQESCVASPSTLLLSAVADSARIEGHDHHPRLCATCTEERHAELTRADAIADTIRERGLWIAIREHGIGYRHACAIRAGWRGADRRAEPIPYRSRGWTNGRRNGWSNAIDPVSESELRAMWGDR